MSNTRNYFYYYYIGWNKYTPQLQCWYNKKVDWDKRTPKHPKLRVCVASFKKKPDPYFEPKLTDPFTIRDGSNRIIFQLTDPYWIAVVVELLIKKS